MAIEKRLIDANALKEQISKEIHTYWTNGSGGYCLAEDVIPDIENAPTVDAVEVVHGMWNEINQMTTGLPWKYRCNKCGCPQDYAHNYCPNCGAKMDGDGNG